jgi:hypothetical protein
MAIEAAKDRGANKHLTMAFVDDDERDSMLDEDENKSKKSFSVYSANKSKVAGSIIARHRR